MRWLTDKVYDLIIYHYSLKKIVSHLLKSPFLVKNPFYTRLYKNLITKKMKKYEKIPFRVMIENTNICHANCTFCPHYKMKRSTGVMNFPLFKNIIDKCTLSGIDYVTIYGFGEPLLDPEFTEKVRYTKSQGIKRVTTNTNAYYLDEKKSREILESGLDEIYISLDAVTHETYKKVRPNLDFKRVEDNIKRFLKMRDAKRQNKPIVILSYVESRFNRNETRQFLSQWRNLVDGISISLIHNWTGDIKYTAHHIKQNNLKKFKRDPCRLLWTDMVISWNGDVPLCCNDYENRIVLGNVKEQSISEIWGGDKLEKIRQWHINSNFEKISICKECEYNYHHKSPWWVSK